jgi:predicted transcriptional regulator
MKTAISIPDEVFEQAEELARRTGKSRSEIYSRAVREYVARYSTDALTQALDDVWDAEPAQAAFGREAARRTFERSEWS